MSKIWMPGEPEKPQPSGGLELPESARRRRPPAPETPATQPPGEETAAAPSPAASTAPSAPPARPAGQPGRGRGADQFLFPPQGVQIQCPSCSKPFAVPVFSIIDFGANPELLGALLSGQVNVANCPSCGFTAPLSAPLMIHSPEHKFLAAYVPPQGGASDMQRQQVIGEMSRALMSRIPQDQRKGYMLQPQQYLDWNRVLEKLWGFQGVTPEMLRRQQEQSNLVQSLLKVADDPTALSIVVERSKGLIDLEFFAMLSQILNMFVSRNAQAEAETLESVYAYLVENTEAGVEVKKQQAAIEALMARLTPETDRAGLLAILVDGWQGDYGEQAALTLATMAAPMIDYQFMLLLTEQIDQAEGDQQESLQALREVLLEVQQQRQQAGSARIEQATAVLQEVLQSVDARATLRQYRDQVDQAFLAVLANNIQQAEQNKATAAARRLRQIYELALEMIQEDMPESMRLINKLLSAPDQHAVRQLLQENRTLVNRELVNSLTELEQRWRESGRAEMADRAKSLRGQVALMV